MCVRTKGTRKAKRGGKRRAEVEKRRMSERNRLAQRLASKAQNITSDAPTFLGIPRSPPFLLSRSISFFPLFLSLSFFLALASLVPIAFLFSSIRECGRSLSHLLPHARLSLLSSVCFYSPALLSSPPLFSARASFSRLSKCVSPLGKLRSTN